MRAALALAGLLMSLDVAAAPSPECKGVQFADQVSVRGSELKLNGIGLQKATFLRVEVYLAALYVSATSQDPGALINSQATQQLVVHFLRNVGVEDIRQQWTRDFTHVAPDRPPALMQRVATLNAWLSDVKRGERLTFVRQPGEGLTVMVGGVTKGTIPGDDFSRTFLSIWVGATPPSAQLRAGLLGGACD